MLPVPMSAVSIMPAVFISIAVVWLRPDPRLGNMFLKFIIERKEGELC
jgi:hypothetical protein